MEISPYYITLILFLTFIGKICERTKKLIELIELNSAVRKVLVGLLNI